MSDIVSQIERPNEKYVNPRHLGDGIKLQDVISPKQAEPKKRIILHFAMPLGSRFVRWSASYRLPAVSSPPNSSSDRQISPLGKANRTLAFP